MSTRFGTLSKLLSSVGVTAAAASNAAEPPAPAAALPAPGADDNPGNLPGANVVEEAVAEEAVRQAHAAGRAEGIKAERERTAQVLASEPAKANMAAAAFMLAETDTVSATIIEKLPALGAPAPAPAAAAPAPSPLTVDLSLTPDATVGAEGGDDDEDEGEKLWAESFKLNGSRPPVTEGGVPSSYGY